MLFCLEMYSCVMRLMMFHAWHTCHSLMTAVTDYWSRVGNCSCSNEAVVILTQESTNRHWADFPEWPTTCQWLSNWPCTSALRGNWLWTEDRGLRLAERIVRVGLAWCEHKHRGRDTRGLRVQVIGQLSGLYSVPTSACCGDLHARWA
jgi:hypothetical protein